MKDLARIIARLKDGSYDGMMIIKNKWLREDCEAYEEPIVLKENKRMLICKAQTGYASLTTTMLAKPRGSAAEAGTIPELSAAEVSGHTWRSFTRQEIVDFVREIGDTNPIHQTDIPVVPGMLLMDCILAELPADIQELELSYRNAVFAGELLELIVRDKTIILQGRAEFVTGIYK